LKNKSKQPFSAQNCVESCPSAECAAGFYFNRIRSPDFFQTNHPLIQKHLSPCTRSIEIKEIVDSQLLHPKRGIFDRPKIKKRNGVRFLQRRNFSAGFYA